MHTCNRCRSTTIPLLLLASMAMAASPSLSAPAARDRARAPAPQSAPNNKQPFILGRINGEASDELSIVNLRFDRKPNWKMPAMEDHGSFLQLRFSDTITTTPGSFYEGNSPYIQKIAVYQTEANEIMVRLFTSVDARLVKEAAETDLLDNRLVVTLDHRALAQKIAASQRGLASARQAVPAGTRIAGASAPSTGSGMAVAGGSAVVNSAANSANSNYAAANFAGANSAGANSAGANSAGANSASANSAGANSPGANSPGSNNLGANSLGANSPGSNNLGANNLGVTAAGANTLGANSRAADSLGANSPNTNTLATDSLGASNLGINSPGANSANENLADTAATPSIPSAAAASASQDTASSILAGGAPSQQENSAQELSSLPVNGSATATPATKLVGTGTPAALDKKLQLLALFSLVFFGLVLLSLTLRRLLRNHRILGSHDPLIKMQALSDLTLAPKQKLTLVQVGHERLLLSVTPEGITLITHLPGEAPSLPAPEAARAIATQRLSASAPAQAKSLPPKNRLNGPSKSQQTPRSEPLADLPKDEASPQASRPSRQEAPSPRRIAVAIDDEGIKDQTLTAIPKPRRDASTEKAIDDVTKLIREKLKSLPKIP